MRHVLLVLVAIAIVAGGCADETPDRSSVLQAVAEDTIVPTLEQLAADANALEAAVDELCAHPSEAALISSRHALADARSSWSVSEAMWVGPVMERRSWGLVDWPIDAARIEELLADQMIEIDVELLSSRIAASQRGLGAVEYFLGGPQDQQPIDAFTEERRCHYLTGIAEVIAGETALLPVDWTSDFEGEGPWADTFAEPETAGLDALINDASFLLEAITDAELGSALGEMGEADPDAIAEGPAGLGAADIADHLAGLRAVLIGDGVSTTGVSLLLGEDLTIRLREAFLQAEASVAAIDGPLAAAVVEQPDVVREARSQVKAIQTLVATEVVSVLGVTIGFSDADGDTGS